MQQNKICDLPTRARIFVLSNVSRTGQRINKSPSYCQVFILLNNTLKTRTAIVKQLLYLKHNYAKKGRLLSVNLKFACDCQDHFSWSNSTFFQQQQETLLVDCLRPHNWRGKGVSPFAGRRYNRNLEMSKIGDLAIVKKLVNETIKNFICSVCFSEGSSSQASVHLNPWWFAKVVKSKITSMQGGSHWHRDSRKLMFYFWRLFG